MTSGLGIDHPSTNCVGGGRSFGSPFGAPAFTQATIVSICAWVSERLFSNFSVCPSSNQGGICRCVHHLLHGLCPRPRVFVGQHRERRALAGTVAGLAMLLHDGRNIFRKGHVGRARALIAPRSNRLMGGWMIRHARHLSHCERRHDTIAKRGLKPIFFIVDPFLFWYWRSQVLRFNQRYKVAMLSGRETEATVPGVQSACVPESIFIVSTASPVNASKLSTVRRYMQLSRLNFCHPLRASSRTALRNLPA